MTDDDRITRAEPRNHNDEQKKIEGQLAELVPESLLDITCLLELAIDRVGQYGCMAHGAEIDMLRNIRAHSWNNCGAAIDEARAEAAEKTKAKICEGFDSMIHHEERIAAMLAGVRTCPCRKSNPNIVMV